ncbi:hypothetical protein E3N88_20522 [Mikania micrantha]|uniref:Uncharacterized protein n=1 Tax=Mikania micrantha TaxID=192012 RepID=A0A5N6NIE7_9ASTR|nr:hypothetical protein E3N88_20522 [Mikania micrantha]
MNVVSRLPSRRLPPPPPLSWRRSTNTYCTAAARPDRHSTPPPTTSKRPPGGSEVQKFRCGDRIKASRLPPPPTLSWRRSTQQPTAPPFDAPPPTV